MTGAIRAETGRGAMLEPVMMDDWDAEEPRPAETRAFWPAWSWPLLLWLPLEAWYSRFTRDMPTVDAGTLARVHLSAAALPWLATATVVLLALAEAGFYGMLWAARGRRLPLLAAAVAIVQCGVAELLAFTLLERAQGGAAVLGALVGARALVARGAAASPLMVAFGGAGLLALARCALFAGFQSRLVPCRWREAFTMTCGVWLASHVAQWWVLELVTGRSFAI
jgi:hypothetical protein